MEILKYSQVDGLYQPGTKRWRINVDSSINIIELAIHKDVSQTLNSKDKDDRSVLDLYAMGSRKS